MPSILPMLARHPRQHVTLATHVSTYGKLPSHPRHPTPFLKLDFFLNRLDLQILTPRSRVNTKNIFRYRLSLKLVTFELQIYLYLSCLRKQSCTLYNSDLKFFGKNSAFFHLTVNLVVSKSKQTRDNLQV